MIKLKEISKYIKLLDDFYKSIVFKSISLKFLESIIIFIISLIVIRYLGPTDYGKLNYIFSIITILRPIYIFGMPGVLQAKLSRNKRSKVLINQLITIQFSLFIGVSTLAIFLLRKVFLFEDFSLFIILQLAFGFRLFDLFTQSLFIFNKGLESLKINLISAIKLLILISIVWKLNLGITAVALAYLINYSTDLISIDRILNSNNLSSIFFKIKLNFRNLNNNLKKGFPLAASGLIAMILQKSDVIFITYFLGIYSSGIYSAPCTLVFKISVFLNLITLNLIPSLNHEFSRNMDKKSIKLYFYTWFISFFAAITFYFLGPLIISYGFGDEYKESLKLIPLFSLVIFFNGLKITANAFLNFYNFENIIFRKALISILINIFLNIILIPNFGLNGVLISLLVSTIFNAVGGYLFNKDLKNHYRNLIFPDLRYLFSN